MEGDHQVPPMLIAGGDGRRFSPGGEILPLREPRQFFIEPRGVEGDRNESFDVAPRTGASLHRSDSSTSSFKNAVRQRDHECITHVDPIILHQKWTIANFNSLIKLSSPGSCLRSAVFRDPGLPDSCWQLCMYPGGKREENANNVSLFLKMSSTVPNKEVIVKAEYRFFFLDDKDQPRFTNVNIGDFHAKPPKGGHSWGLRNIPKQKVMNSIRADNSLVISCVIELMPDVSRIPCKKVSASSGPTTEMMSVSKVHIANELKMFMNGDQSDMKIIIGENGHVFNVHKYKLMAQSDVFRAMLEHQELTECKTGELIVKDFSEVAVRAMLEFVYCGHIASDISIDEYAEAMELAEKYNVFSLKSICEDQLVSKVNSSTVIEAIVLADRHMAQSLFDHCIEIIVSQRSKIVESSNWKSLKEHNPRLANTILEIIVSYDQVPPTKRSRL
ncbi:unnamed protein product [Auanema sp. JU1783]|nr:unnamed protein product [Auanema sp. JU1783]